METNIHTFRSVRFSLRENRMAHQTPTPEEQARAELAQSDTVMEQLRTEGAGVPAVTEAVITDMRRRLNDARGRITADPALQARLDNRRAELLTAFGQREERDRALTTLTSTVTPPPPNSRRERLAHINAGANAAEKKERGVAEVTRSFTEVRKAADEGWHNMGSIMKNFADHMDQIFAIDATIKGEKDAAAAKDVHLTDAAVAPGLVTDHNTTWRPTFETAISNFIQAAQNTPPLVEPLRSNRLTAARTALDTSRTARFTHIADKAKEFIDGVADAPGKKRPTDLPLALRTLATQRAEINEAYFNTLRLAGVPLTVGAPPSTVTTVTGTPSTVPEALDALGAGKPLVITLREKIINSDGSARALADIASALVAVNTHFRTVAAGTDRTNFTTNLNTVLRPLSRSVRLKAGTDNELELVDGASVAPSTPSVTPAEVETAIDTFPADIKAHLRELRRLSAANKPVADAAVQTAFNAVNTWYSGFTIVPATRETHWRNIVTALSGTRYRVELATPTTLRIVDAPSSVAPTGPVSAEDMAALPPLPAGLERPANRFFSEGLGILRLVNEMGILPDPLVNALNSMNGRERGLLTRQLNARRGQLTQAQRELTTETDATRRTAIERRIRALTEDIRAREEQLRALGGAVGSGNPENRRMMMQLMRMMLGMQRGGRELGVMPWMRRTGGMPGAPYGRYGFDLYGLNNGGNLVMGHGARQYGNQFGYHPYGGAPQIVNYGPMYVNGATGGVQMGGGMGGTMIPGRLPFPPRTGPFPGGGYVMGGGGYFTGPKPSGNDSRPR